MRRVAVTGVGIISPLGLDRDTTWANLLAGKSGAGKITHFDASAYTCQVAAEVKDFNPETIVPAKDIRRYDRFSLFSLAAAQNAWEDSGLTAGDFVPSKSGVIIGVGIGGLPSMESGYDDLLQGGPRKVSPFLIPTMISNLAPGHVAIKYGLQGVNYTVTSACTSGTHAIGEAYRMIKDGLQDIVLTGGAESSITPLAIAGFARMRALTTRNEEPTKASRPFDKDRDGFLMGEGAAILVLEEMEAAKKRGAHIYAEVTGYGFSCDAYHITGQPEDGSGAQACMSMALANAKLSPKSIDYINAHGTSTPVNDPTETHAIKTVFGDHAKNGLVVSSTKSMTGHLLGGAGGLEGAILALTIENGMVPPTINLDNPDPGCDLDYVPNQAREMKVTHAMSNSFGFGGTNASVILSAV